MFFQPSKCRPRSGYRQIHKRCAKFESLESRCLLTSCTFSGDYNGDGVSDVLWQNESTGVVGAWLISKATKISTWKGFSTMNLDRWTVVGVGDFNNDGTSDILWQNTSTNVLRMWIMKNAKIQKSPSFSTVNLKLWAVAGVGDFNGDGTDDILLQNQLSGIVGVEYVKNATFSSWVVVGAPKLNTWKVVGAGDFNGDGTSDILWQNTSTGLVTTWIILNRTISKSVSISTANPSVWSVVGIGDYNADGTSDILWQNSSTGVVCVWIIKNATFRRSATLGQMKPTLWNVVGAGDYNGDGTADVLWQNISTGAIGAWMVKNVINKGWAAIGTANPSIWTVIGGSQMSAALQAASVDTNVSAASLTQSGLNTIVAEAITRWTNAGLSQENIAKLQKVKFVITDLANSLLGVTVANCVYIDVNAAGNGWFIDVTPTADEEYKKSSRGELTAVDAAAIDHMDLLTVVEHELGHVLGLDDLNILAKNVMNGVLGVGIRRTSAASIDSIFTIGSV